MGLEFSGSCFLNYFYLKIYKIFYLKNIYFLISTHKIIKKHKNKNILIFLKNIFKTQNKHSLNQLDVRNCRSMLISKVSYKTTIDSDFKSKVCMERL